MDAERMLSDCLMPHMVATVRANYARHVGEPEWTRFVADLSKVSAEFAALWATHEVAEPMPQIKSFWCGDTGKVDVRTASFAVTGMPESRMVVYLPASAADAAKIETLRAIAALRRGHEVSAAS